MQAFTEILKLDETVIPADDVALEAFIQSADASIQHTRMLMAAASERLGQIHRLRFNVAMSRGAEVHTIKPGA